MPDPLVYTTNATYQAQMAVIKNQANGVPCQAQGFLSTFERGNVNTNDANWFYMTLEQVMPSNTFRGNSQFAYEKPDQPGVYEIYQLDKSNSALEIQMRSISRNEFSRQAITQAVMSEFGQQRYYQGVNDDLSEDGVLFCLDFINAVSIDDGGRREMVFEYAIDDVPIYAPRLIRDNVPAISLAQIEISPRKPSDIIPDATEYKATRDDYEIIEKEF